MSLSSIMFLALNRQSVKPMPNHQGPEHQRASLKTEKDGDPRTGTSRYPSTCDPNERPDLGDHTMARPENKPGFDFWAHNVQSGPRCVSCGRQQVIN